MEKYAKKIQLAESVYAKSHNGEKMDNIRKVTVAKCLDNVSKFLNESFESSMGTQRAAMGEYKKFCLALTNVGLPNLIAFDLVTVSPMSSIYGNVAYIEYNKGTTKGQSTQGDLVNGIWELGNPDINYTGQAVVESKASSGTFTPGFTPVAHGFYVKDSAEVDPHAVTDGTWYKYKTISSASTPVIAYSDTVDSAFTGKVCYKYDNVVVPQTTLPTLKAELKNIGLEAKARRIAVYYSQMAAFQAKTDYGFDLADGLAEQAVGQLSYEIDTEIVDMLYEASKTATATGVTNFSKTQPVGVNLADHYAAFAAKLEEYKMVLYKRTKKFSPNFMVVSADVMPILSFVPGYQGASVNDVNGPYYAGSISGLKVYVSPALASMEFFLGVNQGAMQASAGVYAPLDGYALVA